VKPRPERWRREPSAESCQSPTEGIIPKLNTPKLNDTQLVILWSASQRDEGLALVPEGLKAAAAKATIAKLLVLRFLKEVRVKRDQPAWRTDEEQKPIGLKLRRRARPRSSSRTTAPARRRPPQPERPSARWFGESRKKLRPTSPSRLPPRDHARALKRGSCSRS